MHRILKESRIMINFGQVQKKLEGLAENDLYDAYIELRLFGKKLIGNDAFQFKKMLLSEFSKRGRLTVKIDQGKGDPYRTKITILNGMQTDQILRKCRFIKGSVECIVREGSNSVLFLEEAARV